MPPQKPDYRLRAAGDDDYSFIEGLYIETMKPLLAAFDAWDQKSNVDLFKKKYYKRREAKVIVVGGIDIGWLQLHEGKHEIAIHQIHIKRGFRGQGIGTSIIKRILTLANVQESSVTLSVVKNNPALSLYRRLGFSIVREDKTKFHLSTRPS